MSSGHVALPLGPSKAFLRDPRALRLGLKYAYIWKTRVEALRLKTHCAPSSDRCPVHHVILRAADGAVNVLRREQLPRLKAGCLPFAEARVRARFKDIPAQLPPHLYFVPLDHTVYLGVDAPDFATLQFTAPTRVYILLPTVMREPRWLRDHFVKFRDPGSGNHLGLPASWHFGSGMALLLASGMRYQAFVRQRFMVWESMKTYSADQELVLGGPGLAEMGDTCFIIAVRSVGAAPAAGAASLPPTYAFSPFPLAGAGAGGVLLGPTSDTQLGPGLYGGSGTSGHASRMFPAAAGSSAAAAAGSPRVAAASDDGSGNFRIAGGSQPAIGADGGPPNRPSDPGAAGSATWDDRQSRPSAGPPPLFWRRDGGGGGGGWGQGMNGGYGGGGGGGGAGGGAQDAAAWLLQRFIKVVKRDRVQDLRVLLESEPWQRYCMSPEEVSFLPPGERWPCTVDLAVANMSVPLLVELVDRAGCHLNYRSLKLLAAQWDRLPDHSPGGGEGLLLRYLVRAPNPLSVIGACLLAMRGELNSGRNHSTALQGAVSRFKAVQLELLAQLHDSYYRTSEEARQDAGLPLLEDILENPAAISRPQAAAAGLLAAAAAAAVPNAIGSPAGGPAAGTAAGGGAGGVAGAGANAAAAAAGAAPPAPLVLSDYSPLRLAFRDYDTQFMSAQLVEGYTRRRWLGPEYSQLTALDGHNRLSGLDPLFVYTIVENLGFVGDAGHSSMQATMRLWHLVTLTSPAFFRSPRGRWAVKFMSTFAFLGMYMAVLSSYQDIRAPDGGPWRALHCAFVVFAAGNVLEGLEVMAMRYRNSAGRYFTSAPGEVVGWLVDAGIIASVLPCLITAYMDQGHAASHFSKDQWTMLRMAQATLAIFVWVRSLLVMVPLYRKLGPLIRTMNRMAGEILAFVPLYVSVTLGFAAAFHTSVGTDVPAYDSWTSAVRTLFSASLGTFSYDDLEGLDERARVYAQLLLSTYLVLAAILLTNLLIAIISYKYRPEEVRAESVFDLAEMVDRYRFQVKHNLICSPFNLLLLIFTWLPASPMPKLPPYVWVKYGLTPLDGLTFATPGYPTTPGGRDEIPHLCYLLTLFPLIIVTANVLYFVHAPYAVMYWAFTGHKKLLRELLGTHPSHSGSGGPSSGTAADAAAASGHSTTRPGASGPSRFMPPLGGNSGVFNLGRASPTTSGAGQKPEPARPSADWFSGPATAGSEGGLSGGAVGGGSGGGGKEVLKLSAVAASAIAAAAAAGPASSDGSGSGGGADGGGGMRGSGSGHGGGHGTAANVAGASWVRRQQMQQQVQQQQQYGILGAPVVRNSEETAAAGSDGRQSLEDPFHRLQQLQPPRQQQQQQPPRAGPGPIAEKVEGDSGASHAGAPLKGASYTTLPLSPLGRSTKGAEAAAGAGGAGGGGGGGGPGGWGGNISNLRSKSMRSMHAYALGSRSVGSGSGRSLSAHVDEANLYDDLTYDNAAVQPPYMMLMQLVTFSGLRDAAVAALRTGVLLLVGTLLYVLVMGLLGGTLGCCLVVWVGSVGVSVYRVVAGAWRGAFGDLGGGDGGSCLCGYDGDVGVGGVRRRDGDLGGGGAFGPGKGGSTRIASLARAARLRSSQSTYLTKSQVESAVRSVYAAANVLSMWTAGGGGGGGGGSVGGGGGGGGASAGAALWAAASTKARRAISARAGVGLRGGGGGPGTAAAGIMSSVFSIKQRYPQHGSPAASGSAQNSPVHPSGRGYGGGGGGGGGGAMSVRWQSQPLPSALQRQLQQPSQEWSRRSMMELDEAGPAAEASSPPASQQHQRQQRQQQPQQPQQPQQVQLPALQPADGPLSPVGSMERQSPPSLFGMVRRAAAVDAGASLVDVESIYPGPGFTGGVSSTAGNAAAPELAAQPAGLTLPPAAVAEAALYLTSPTSSVRLADGAGSVRQATAERSGAGALAAASGGAASARPLPLSPIATGVNVSVAEAVGAAPLLPQPLAQPGRSEAAMARHLRLYDAAATGAADAEAAAMSLEELEREVHGGGLGVAGGAASQAATQVPSRQSTDAGLAPGGEVLRLPSSMFPPPIVLQPPQPPAAASAAPAVPPSSSRLVPMLRNTSGRRLAVPPRPSLAEGVAASLGGGTEGGAVQLPPLPEMEPISMAAASVCEPERLSRMSSTGSANLPWLMATGTNGAPATPSVAGGGAAALAYGGVGMLASANASVSSVSLTTTGGLLLPLMGPKGANLPGFISTMASGAMPFGGGGHGSTPSPAAVSDQLSVLQAQVSALSGLVQRLVEQPPSRSGSLASASPGDGATPRQLSGGVDGSGI